jgi:hypothetical protein
MRTNYYFLFLYVIINIYFSYHVSEHSHQKCTVDLCVKDSNLNIATRHTMWIYAIVQTEYNPMQPKSMRKGSWSSSPTL